MRTNTIEGRMKDGLKNWRRNCEPRPIARNRWGKSIFQNGVTESGPDSTLFSQSRKFLVLTGDPSVRNLKFLAGAVITNGDIHCVAQHLTKELSMALYTLGAL
jgi:hypothetical protein